MTTSSPTPDDTVGGHVKAGFSEFSRAAGIAKKKPGQGLSFVFQKKFIIPAVLGAAIGYGIWGGDSEPVRVVAPTADIGVSAGKPRQTDKKKETVEPTFGTTFNNTFVATTKPQTDTCGAWVTKDQDGTEFVVVNLDVINNFSAVEFKQLGQNVDKFYDVGNNIKATVNCDITQARLYAFPRHDAYSSDMGAAIFKHFQSAVKQGQPGQFLFSNMAPCDGPRSVVIDAKGRERCLPATEAPKPGETRTNASHRFTIFRSYYNPDGKKGYKYLSGVAHQIQKRELYPGE